MKLRTLYLYIQVVIEFFAWEAIWGASSMLKTIYYSRFALMCVPLVAILTMAETISTWPRSQKADGEESLVLQGEFKAVQQRNHEIDMELRSESVMAHQEIKNIQLRMVAFDESQKRIEDKLNLGMKVLWSICTLLIVRVVLPLLKIGLRREISRMAKEGETI